uniref:14-3-3 domain-containing protein n=1 Tax=Coccolithus braarudii TaxID=221442 RepID=A0A7S0LFP5_9EUKA|mmetsp:Transcript_37937/g.80746  ORF Transcript_37937/g.80746 Transcript_37937/m.80746 type:complete len:185 (+) Transcript_37937:1-555(+)
MWRITKTILTQELDKPKPNKAHLVEAQLYRVQGECRHVAQRHVQLMEAVLFPNATTPEDRVWYQRMAIDAHQCLAEQADGDQQKLERGRNVESGYEACLRIALEELHAAHPVRLGILLNASVWFYETKRDAQRGMQIAKEAFDACMQVVDGLDENERRDAQLIAQLIRDNLNMWTEEVEVEPGL